MITRKQECHALALSALCAAVFLLFFSRSSPLYPTNPWGEANAFFTVGRSMLAGKVPYRDLCLGAGPVVYAIHALAACISGTSFLGVWVMEIIAMTGALFFAWKAAVHISGMPALSMGVAALMGLLLVSSRAFIYGDTVEEFALPLQMWAMFDLMVYVSDPERRMSTYRLVLHGFLAGCVFWLKYTLCGVHFAFIAVIAVDSMVRERSMKDAIWMCIDFAAGLVIAAAPWIAYYGANGALKELYALYLDRNWASFAESVTPLRSAFAALASGAIRNPPVTAAMLCGAGFLLRRLVQRRWNLSCTAVVAAFACMALFAFMDGERYRFTPVAVGSFLMLCAGPIAMLLCYAWRQRRVYAAAVGCIAVLIAGYGCWINENLPFIGYPAEELPQAIFAEYIEENGGGTIQVQGIADHGFYLAAGQIPEYGLFAESKAYDAPYDGIVDKDKGSAEWIISRSKYGGYGAHILVQTATSPYDCATDAQGKVHKYYLYHRLDK